MYFVIHNSEGDTTVDEYTEEELLRNIEEGYWGDIKVMDVISDNDTNYWGNGILIIKGTIAKITPIETVTKYRVE